MSLLFTPKIAETFEHIKPDEPIVPVVLKVVAPIIVAPILDDDGRLQSAWSSREIQLLVELRAQKLTYKECGKHLNRSLYSCAGAINTHDLHGAIADKQQEQLNAVLAAHTI
jgi:hypothetical protein